MAARPSQPACSSSHRQINSSRPALLATTVTALAVVVSWAMLAIVFPSSPADYGRGGEGLKLLQERSQEYVLRVCPECKMAADAGSESLSSLLGGPSEKGRAARSRSRSTARSPVADSRQQLRPQAELGENEEEEERVQQAEEQPMARHGYTLQRPGGVKQGYRLLQAAQARTQQLPYRVSGSIELPQPSYSTVTTTSSPDVAIRFTESRLEPPEGMNAPIVPKAVWEDAQATKRMAARLKRVLKKQKGAANDMQKRVDRLRAFIVDNASGVVQDADTLDAKLSKLILEKETRGIRGRQGAPGTPGFPGPAGAQGTNGSPGVTGARGRRGVRGVRGPAGAAGPAGPAGWDGVRGPVGPRGPVGKRGELGPQGHEPGSYLASLRRPSLSSFDPSLCPDGDNGVVRLAACTSESCRLEVLHQQHWGSVCDDKFTPQNARVVCTSLGYAAHRAEALHSLGGGTGRVWLDDVECTGAEEQITMCKHAGWGLSDCDHDEDVGVCCSRF